MIVKTVENTLKKGMRSKNRLISNYADSFYYSLKVLTTPIIEIEGVKVKIGRYMSEKMREVFYEGMYETAELEILKETLISEDKVLELGAGIGFLSAFCAKKIGSDRVFAFEGNPELEKRILENYSLNQVAPKLEITVLAHGEGVSKFYIRKDFWGSSAVKEGKGEREVEVPMKSFNEALKQINPSYLIVDIEGGEWELFRKADLNNVKKLLIEFHPHIIGEDKIEQIKQWLETKGYREDKLKQVDKVHYFKLKADAKKEVVHG